MEKKTENKNPVVEQQAEIEKFIAAPVVSKSQPEAATEAAEESKSEVEKSEEVSHEKKE